MREKTLALFIFLFLAVSYNLAASTETVTLNVQSLEFHDPNNLTESPKAKLAPSPGVDQAALNQLPETRCMWMAESEEAILSWDSIAHFQPPLDNNADSISACTNRQPGTGAELTIDGEHFDMTGWSGQSSLLTCIASSTPEPPNRYRECRTPQLSCYQIPQICPSNIPDTNFPLCQHQCNMQPWPVNFTYKIESGPVVAGGGQTFSGFFTPSFSVVQSSEALSRRLTFSPNDSNVDAHEYAWTWTVPSLPEPDGRWEENFSPQLMITGVKAFIPNPNVPGGVQYLILQSSKPVRVKGVSFQPCDTNSEDGTEANGDSCSPLLEATPAYLRRTIGTKIEWLLKISGAPAEPQNQGLNENSEVYIQFHLTSKLNNPGHVSFYPSRKELGSYDVVGGPYQFTNVFKMDNTHTASIWTVESIAIGGPNASEFSPVIFGGRSVPFDVNPGGSFHFGAVFSPTSMGEKSAIVQLSIRDRNGNQIPFSGELHAWVQQRPHVAFVPTSLSFKNKPRKPDMKDLEVRNTGAINLVRRDIAIKGTDSASFQVLGERNQPPPQRKVIPPGQKEIIHVVFVPAQPLKSNYDARLRINTNAGGDKFVDLKGKA